MPDYIVQEEDGTSHLTLEEGGGDLLLEESGNQARVSQLPVEVAYEGDPKARVSQLAVEVGYQGDPKARISQLVVEVAVMQLHESSHVVIIDPTLKPPD